MYALEEEDAQRLIIVDIPLLYESKLDNLFDKVLVVYVPREVQLARLMERNGLNPEQAAARLDAQMDIEEKRRRADYIIDNSGETGATEQQVAILWDRLGLS